MDITKEIEEIDGEVACELEFISNDRRKLDINNNIMKPTTINIDIFEEIPITTEESNFENSIDTFKSTLMSTIEKLYSTIDFLQKEIEEKNYIIKSMFTKDADGGRDMDEDLFRNLRSAVLQELIETTPIILAKNNDLNNVISVEDNDALETYTNSSNDSANISLEKSNISIINECHVPDNCSNYDNNRSRFIPEYESSNVSLNSSNELEMESVFPSMHVKKSIKVQTEEYRNICHTNYLNHLNHLNNKTTDKINDIHKKGQSIDRGLNNKFINGITVNNAPSLNNYIDNINVYDKDININALWKPKTTLIIGDSMLNGLDEKRLKNCKVRAFSGSSIEDMHFHIVPLLRKRPSTIIIHVGCNNCVDDNSTEIMKKLTSLKEFILCQLDCKLIFSSIIDRCDDMKAQFTGNLTNKYLSNLGVDIIYNDNITTKHLGRKGHHMTPRGTGQLAINFIRVLKSL